MERGMGVSSILAVSLLRRTSIEFFHGNQEYEPTASNPASVQQINSTTGKAKEMFLITFVRAYATSGKYIGRNIEMGPHIMRSREHNGQYRTKERRKKGQRSKTRLEATIRCYDLVDHIIIMRGSNLNTSATISWVGGIDSSSVVDERCIWVLSFLWPLLMCNLIGIDVDNG